jgi:hypothetical protein
METSMLIILLSGYAGSGKTTACGLLTEILKPRVSIAAFADAVKDEVAAMYGFDRRLCDTPAGKKSVIVTDSDRKTVRDLLIEHSAAMKFTHGNSGYWADIVADRIRESSNTDSTWILHDWRYKREIQALRVAFPDARLVTIRIVRPDVTPLTDPSEHDLDGFPMDHVLMNDGDRGALSEKLRAIVG